MTTATLTSKGQITLPKQVRDELGLEAGDRVDFVVAADGRYSLVPVKASIRGLKGCIPAPKKPVSVEAMARVVKRRAVRGAQ
ncbi:MAG: AbrB/MazE/SpoVT family DNA-binding domain-containing protein [Betaproteobacteria bacterium]|nr:AbrB/MazE/SpoVT family DNA-binding domain-containing protein [Betaproteobacteria bacterium]